MTEAPAVAPDRESGEYLDFTDQLFDDLIAFGCEMPTANLLPLTATVLGPFRWDAKTRRVAMPVYAPFDTEAGPRPRMIDILLWSVDRPREFTTAYEHVSFIGLDDLGRAVATSRPLMVVGNPVQWVAAKAAGELALLRVNRNSLPWWEVLDGVPRLVFGDKRIGDEVADSLRRRPRPSLGLAKWSAAA